MDQKRFNALLRRIVVIPVFALAILAGLLLLQVQSLTTSLQRVDHTDEVIATSREVMRLAIDMETGLRGYLITGNQEFLQPHDQAAKVIDSKFDDLNRLVSDNPAQQQQLAQVRGRFNEWRQFAEDALHKPRSADTLEGQIKRKQLMDSVRAEQDKFIAAEESLRSQRVRTARSRSRFITITFILTSLGIGVFLALFTRRQMRTLATTFDETLRLTKERAEALRESEAQFRTLANAMPQLAWMANADGWIFWYNDRWYSYTGTTPQQMEGWGWQSVHDPETLPEVMTRWKTSISTGRPFDMTFPLRGSDRIFRAFLTRVVPIKDSDGKVVRWFGTNTDISEQKRIESDLRKSNERLDLAVSVASLGEFDLDLTNHTASRSLRHSLIFGYQVPLPRWTYEMFLDHVLPEYRTEVDRKFKAAPNTGGWEVETQIRRADGEIRWIWIRGQCHIDEAGRPARMFGVVMDTTERKRAEEARARLAAIVESSSDAIISKDLDGIVQTWNESAEHLFGYTAAEIIGRPITLIIPPDRLHEEVTFLERLRAGGRIDHYETIRIDKNGREFDVSITISPIRNAAGQVIGVSKSVRDITERRRAEEALRASEERWKITLKSIGDAVISTTATGEVVFMNDVAQKLTGWPLDEARGKQLSEIFNIVQEVTRLRPEDPVAKVIRSGKVVGLANHTLLISRDGTERAIDDSAAPIRDIHGQLDGVVLVFHDVSEQRRAELALRNNERLATTGRLAATVAHEIHNPLDAVGNLLFIIGQETTSPAIREHVEMASNELMRVTQMTRQMLTFQREAAKPAPLKTGEIMASVLALYDRKIKSAKIQVDTEFDTDREILAFPGELRQVFANLLGNAIEAVQSKKGKIRLRAYESRDHRNGRAGIRLVVADNGVGIAPEARAKVFEPFFTTKGEGGTGLGLWIAADIIRKYDGTMKLWSSTRNGSSGTCFSVFLPFQLCSELPERQMEEQTAD